MSTQTILLSPRPLARIPGKLLLLPLLPLREPAKHLPAEIWGEILFHALLYEIAGNTTWCWTLVLVCKTFKDIALPLIYSKMQTMNISVLEKFYNRIYSADQQWDSIRRIPYSTPGRWVQCLDLSELAFVGQSQALLLDSILTNLFPLLPFLSTLHVNPSFVLSRRALYSLCEREGAANLRVLGGLTYISPPSPTPMDDPFVRLLQCCPNLEELEIVGLGLEPMDHDFGFLAVELPPMEQFHPLHLPKLRTLCLLAMHSSPLMLALLYSPLPALHKLTVTPYDDLPFPNSLVSALITAHGESLRSLLLFTPKSWPTRLHPSPDSLFSVAPNLRHLSLESPLPELFLSQQHDLQILSIPRPNQDFWRVLQRLFPRLPKLAALRARDVRWLRKGISSMAQDTGVQGEMREWRRRLARRRIRLLDADWNEESLA